MSGGRPHHWGGATSLGWGPVTGGRAHLTGGGALSLRVGPTSLGVGPRHWGRAHLTGMEPPHWGRILISGDARRGEARSCHSAVCVRDQLSAASSLPHLSANLPLLVGSYFSVADLEGKCNSMLSQTCKCVRTCVYRPVLLQRFQPQTCGHGNPLTYPYLGPENWRQKV